MNRSANRVLYHINKSDEKWLEERIGTINPHKKMYNFVYDKLFDKDMSDILLKFIIKYGLRPDIINFEDCIYPGRKKDIFFNRKKFELILSYFHKETLNNVIHGELKPIELLLQNSIMKMKRPNDVLNEFGITPLGSIIPKTSITILNLLIKYGAEVKYIKRSFVRGMIRNVLTYNKYYKQRKIIHKMYKILINNGLDTSISIYNWINDKLIKINLLEVSFLVNNFRLAKLLLQSGSTFRNSYQLCLDKAKDNISDKRSYDLITNYDKPLNIHWKTQKTDSPCKIIWTPKHLNIANTLILMTKKHPVTLHGYNSDSIPLDRLGETGIWSKIIEYAVDWRD